MKIALHIERLVLDGLPVTSLEGAQVRAAVERELAAMLATGGLADALRGAMPRVDAPPVDLRRHERPQAIGREIARSLHAAIATPRAAPADPSSHGFSGEPVR